MTRVGSQRHRKKNHQLMKRVTAYAPVADFFIAGFGSVPGVIRNGMSDTFQHGNITDKTDVVEKN